MDQMGPRALPQRQEKDHLRPRPPPEKGQDSHICRHETMRMENDNLAPPQPDQEGTKITYLDVHRTHPRHGRPWMTGFALRAVHPARKRKTPSCFTSLEGQRTDKRTDGHIPGETRLGDVYSYTTYTHGPSTLTTSNRYGQDTLHSSTSS